MNWIKQIVNRIDWAGLSKKRKSYIIGFGVITAVLLWAFISAGVITHNFNRDQLQGTDNQEANAKGVILTETKDDMKYWEIYGETANYDNKSNVASLNNVVGNFYKDNEVAMSFESSSGIYDSEQKKIVLFDDTFIVLKDGLTLQADRLIYAGSKTPITAKGNIKITRGKEFLAQADEVEISPDYEKFKIKGRASSKIFNK